MGLNFGGTKQAANSNSSQSNTYTEGQSSIQDMLAKAFSAMMPGVTGGGITPNVAAVQTAGADQINKTSAGLGDRMNRFLAARGFGQSGDSGKVALNTELGRESALGANASAASGLQLQQNNGWLSDALNFAFSKIGGTASGSSTGNSSGWGVSASGGGVGSVGGIPIGIGA